MLHPPAQAQAAVASAKPTAVDTKFAGGSVRVERSPFRIKLRTKSRRTLLSSLAGQSRSGGVEYSGLGFTLGGVPELEPPSFDPQPPGQVVPGETFVAKRVVDVRRAGSSTTFVIKTDDPEGRRIVLYVYRGRTCPDQGGGAAGGRGELGLRRFQGTGGGVLPRLRRPSRRNRSAGFGHPELGSRLPVSRCLRTATTRPCRASSHRAATASC